MIPVIINNFNRLTTTKKLADDLFRLGYTDIHILDNLSTYPPLLEWYTQCPYKVVRLEANLQQLAIYNSGYINNFLGVNPYIAYTDSDIELNSQTPLEFIEKVVYLMEKYTQVKGGLALKIDDLPNNEYAQHYKDWETKYWQVELEKDVYSADIDTTFSVIRPGVPFEYKAIRVAGDLTAKHIPWYVDFNNLSEEEQYYIDSALEWSTYKRFYHQVKRQKHEISQAQ